jgi:hypothetical protein
LLQFTGQFFFQITGLGVVIVQNQVITAHDRPITKVNNTGDSGVMILVAMSQDNTFASPAVARKKIQGSRLPADVAAINDDPLIGRNPDGDALTKPGPEDEQIQTFRIKLRRHHGDTNGC